MRDDIFHRHESPATKSFSLTDDPPVFVRGDGAVLTDDRGKTYLDFACGSGTSSLGHGHPAIREALRAQINTGICHIGPHFHAEIQGALYSELLSQLPAELSVLHPATNGTEAGEVALKAAMHATGARHFVAFEGSYHGRSFGSLAVSAERGVNERLGPFAPAVTHLPVPQSPKDDGQTCRDVIRAIVDHQEPLAGVLIEPLQATAGMRILSRTFLAAVAEAARTRRIPLIFDEVFTGFARTGRLFAFEHSGLVPDMLILAKAFGGGVPAGLVASRRWVAENWPKGSQSSTFQLHPLAAAASLAALNVIRRENLAARAIAIGAQIESWRGRFMAAPHVAGLRGMGASYGLVIGHDDARNITRAIRQRALAGGLITWECGLEGEVIGLVPPLTIDDAALDAGLSILLDALTSHQ